MLLADNSKSLWIPPWVSDALLVTVDAQADDAAFEGMLLINQCAHDWLDGEIDTGTYFDVLDHFGIDPFEFVGEVEEHVDALIRHG